MMNVNPQMIAQLQQMYQQGMALKNILLNLKNQGFTPQVAEQILFMAFPELKQAQMMIQNSGMNTNDFIGQLARQNRISSQQINEEMSSTIKMFN